MGQPMTAIRVILITVAGPAGHVDVGVRSDATPAELADSLGAIPGVRPPWPAAEHRSPPRPGDPRGQRSLLMPGDALADASVADGDLVLFRKAGENSPGSAPPGTSAGQHAATDAPRAARAPQYAATDGQYAATNVRPQSAWLPPVGAEQGAEPT